MKNRVLSLISFLAFALIFGSAQADTDVFTSSGTWTVPAGVTQVTVEVWGGGGAGGGQDQNSDGGGGGGGGAYSKTVGISVVPGNTYSFVVGAGGVGVAGGTGNAGGDSYFINTSTLLAKGGAGGARSTGSGGDGGAGGSAAAGVGSTKYSGGNGGRGRDNSTGRGGPGGSSAGNAANGTSGASSYSTMTAGVPPVGGGIGGDGGNVNSDGFAPASGNGGGGGGSGEGASRSGGNGADGKIAITYFPCVPPPNIPAGVAVSCVCDTFGRTNLNPSTIFGGNWSLSNSDGVSNPYINATTGFLRLTENTGNNAKAATVPSIFPAAGNYISAEFSHYAYNGSGADGIAMTLSDYSIPAVPGGYGGSLGYAQRSGYVGFAGGWVGVALDEYGNYQNPTEGRVGGSGFIVDSVGIRGPGDGSNGYRWLTGTGSNPGGLGIDNSGSTTPAPGYMYQVVVDARNYATGTVNVQVNRDSTTRDGTSYSTLLGPFNAYTEASYALSQGWITKLVPDYWKISFTGSTGGSTNIHEIGNLRICAQTVLPPTGGNASGFSAIDDAYPTAPSSTAPAYPNFQTGDIYMKLAATPFQLWIGALTTTPAPGLAVGYSATTNKYVQVKLVNNGDGLCGTSASRTCNAACTNKPAVEAGTGATQTALFPSGSTTGVASPNPTFTVNGAYKHLIAVMKECTTSACTAFTATAPACSVGAFSVRPHALKLTTNATNTSTSGVPVFKAGSDAFTFNVEADTYNLALAAPPGLATLATLTSYTGSPKVATVDTSVMGASPMPGGWRAGAMSFGSTLAPAVAGVSSNLPTYDDVGLFRLFGYWPRTAGYAGGDDSSARGVYDGVRVASECASLSVAQCDALKLATAWTGIDSVSTSNDCVQDSFSNLKVSGKYGCSFGITAAQTFGRFIPDSFVASGQVVVPRSDIGACLASTFNYLGEPLQVTNLTLTAKVAGGTSTTQNYVGSYAKLDLGSATARVTNLNSGAQHSGSPAFTNFYNASPALNRLVVSYGGTAYTDTYPPADPDCPNARKLDWCRGRVQMSLDFRVHRAVNGAPDGPFVGTAPGVLPFVGTVLGIGPVDSDGVGMFAPDYQRNYAGGGVPVSDGKVIAQLVGAATPFELRFGRVWLGNGYGSERNNLSLPFEMQYWNGRAFVTNTLDSCTPLAAANVALGNPQGSLAPAYAGPVAVSATSNGVGTITLTAPGAGVAGSVDLMLALGAVGVPNNCNGLSGGTSAGFPYLAGRWCGAAFDRNPVSRATFGINRSNRQIFLREGY